MANNYHYEVDVRLALTLKNPMRSCVYVFGTLDAARSFVEDMLENEPVICIAIYRYSGSTLEGVVETHAPRLSRSYYKIIRKDGK